MKPFRVAIFGAGNIGTALAVALAESPDYEVTLSDISDETMDKARRLGATGSYRAAHRNDSQRSIAIGQDLIVAAVPDTIVPQIAQVAAAADSNFLDFSHPSPATKSALQVISKTRAIMNGCGASPGLSENVAVNLASMFSEIDDLTIRVGAIPRFAANRLGYGRIWNMNGLFDEYMLPSAALRNGQPTSLSSLEGHEEFTIDGVGYEAFNTASGTPDAISVANVKIKNLTFKTIRHPGHLEYVKFLFDDLGLRKRRDMLTSLLGNGLPEVKDDVVLMFITARGKSEGRIVEKSIFHRLSPSIASERFNALTRVAVGYAATLIEQLRAGAISSPGFVEHWRMPTNLFMESPMIAEHPSA